MASEAHEEFGTGSQRARHVELADAARARPALLLAALVDDRGPVVLLDEPRRDEADDARRQVLVSDEQERHIPFFRDQLLREVDRFLRRLPAFAIQPVQLLRDLARLLLVVADQQVEREARVRHPACRVEARPQPEADRLRVDARGVQVGDVQ